MEQSQDHRLDGQQRAERKQSDRLEHKADTGRHTTAADRAGRQTVADRMGGQAGANPARRQ